MANKNDKKVGIVDVNEDNFEQHVNNVGKFTEDEIALANENETKEIKERKARDFNRAKYQASYQKMRIVADCVYSKKCMEAQKKAMKAIDAEFEKIQKGEIDLIDFDAAREKAIDEAIKEVKELGNTRRTNIRKLQEQYPGHWSYSWDDPFQRLNRAIEDNKNLR